MHSYSTVSSPQLINKTVWEYTPVIAKRCIVVVDDDNHYPNYWARPIVGKKRQVVEVLTKEGKTYLDNEDGSGWLRVTELPNGNFRELKARSVIAYLD